MKEVITLPAAVNAALTVVYAVGPTVPAVAVTDTYALVKNVVNESSSSSDTKLFFRRHRMP